ncbi:hypothetical protein [Paenibacillus hamazuiensis]|uniref:hypothetical protein n=1 Tax=Paenibacillus hamazuiensis TaxID=2936508 RepID=UPI00201062EC|nr:hypothetical protein [Paenibacillus hamazuiensis]
MRKIFLAGFSKRNKKAPAAIMAAEAWLDAVPLCLKARLCTAVGQTAGGRKLQLFVLIVNDPAKPTLLPEADRHCGSQAHFR